MRRLALLLGLLVIAAGCTNNDARVPASVQGVQGQAGTRVMRVTINSCNQNPQVEVDESATEVRLTVTVEDTDDLNDCADGETVVLAAPLGKRRVVDVTTDSELPLQPYFGLPCYSTVQQHRFENAPGSPTPLEAAQTLTEPGQIFGGVVERRGRMVTLQFVSPGGEPIANITTLKDRGGGWVAPSITNCHG